MAVPNIFATATTSIPLSQLDANFAYFANAITVNYSSTALTIDSSGNVGIGTASPISPLQVVGQGRFGAGPSDATNATVSIYNDGTGISIEAFQGNNSNNKRNLWLAAYGGNVGVGTSSPNVKLEVNGTVGSYSTDGSFDAKATTGTARLTARSNARYWSWLTSNGDDALRLNDETAGSERLRVNSSGELLIGTTTASSTSATGIAFKPNSFSEMRRDSAYILGLFITNTNTGPFIEFRQNTVVRGTISTDGSTTSYNTTSDYRLKENVAPLQNGLSIISSIKPVRYKWKENGAAGEGFIAHELAEHIPLAVTGKKDELDDKGNIRPQSVDYSKLVVHLVSAVQELSAKIDEANSRIAKLEGAK